MLIVVNQLFVQPDWLDRIEAAFLEHLELLEATPGFAGFRFLKPANPELSPCLIEVCWADEAAFDAWKDSEHFRVSHARMGAFREAFSGPPKFGRYTVSRDLPLRG
ncbi:MAG: antibiotic biosynthesis monooxygenase [Candidatus Sericytochromatia bacterium]